MQAKRSIQSLKVGILTRPVTLRRVLSSALETGIGNGFQTP
jgi:hypothetical protein